MEVPRTAKTDEARTAAGHDLIQWQRFYMITREEARKHVQGDPTRSWPSVAAHEKKAMLDRINQLLANEDIPEVSQSLFLWRMKKAIQDAKEVAREAAREEAIAAARGAARLAARTGAPPSGTEVVEDYTAGRLGQASRRRPFDPVRDY
ncbi:uncharacterized protein EI97DRAFT_466046 [Westerdykella ornata]|uniref:Uncharacterized protein n=1 Tax=Westerdykella ornata TaxID=318751 RepID=A0A6A6JP68_WESOR|nr:uncharacterized protein EI97DRAFT_466046 [Westerdykella ornata]KAF2277933.1 hypothetical protein EI97DRAFT_466046 [Westerdykella ornata]